MRTAQQIAAAINAAGRTYYGVAAKGWSGTTCSRIYFGRYYVTIAADGEVHVRKAGRARAQTAGLEAAELVEEFARC